MFSQYIENGIADVHRRIVAANFFKGAMGAAFAEEAGRIIGDVNYVHPFREGNGRSQLLYLHQLSGASGHPLDLRHIEADAWIEASKRAHDAGYAPMGRVIGAALERSPGRPESPRADAVSNHIHERLADAERESTQRGNDPKKKSGRLRE